jgi:hypothetical protein
MLWSNMTVMMVGKIWLSYIMQGMLLSTVKGKLVGHGICRSLLAPVTPFADPHHSKADPSYAFLEWSAIQTLFENANFDVLLLLDCCAAASAAPGIGAAVTETIAAYGFESIAPQPGQYSFTNTLIEVLEDWIDSPPFSAAQLHNKVLSVLKHEQPVRA